jgi:hypothetical protein
MHRDREEEMSVPMFGHDFSLAQMESAIRLAYEDGRQDQSEDVDSEHYGMESVALIICEAANLPMLDVLNALQRLEEWRSSQRDHP